MDDDRSMSNSIKSKNKVENEPELQLNSTIEKKIITTQEIMNRTTSKAGKMFRKESAVSRQSRSRLSRMNSKMSMVTSRKKGPGAGLKSKIDELSKLVQEMKLNSDKNIEDIRVLRNTEYDRKQRFDHMEEIVFRLQKSHDIWNADHEVIKSKQAWIDDQHTEGMNRIEYVHSDMQKIYKDTQKVISLFRKEYKLGFERIVRCEVQLSEVQCVNLFSSKPIVSKYSNRKQK